ncbi:filamentous hemagglutinin N-terminal domain-containing protein, partial [Hydrocarboniphaga effusa]|uniref:filamentous hemagglutinin N-terminal domain-containing protein n=1 Tax=Hydrocarboniphaga effusa TaxID=243629 RepID=UPI0035AEEB7C
KWKRSALLSGMGLSVMAATTWSGAAPAANPQFGSAAYFAQRTGAPAPTAKADAAAGNLGQNVGSGVVTTPEQARIRAERSITNLSRAVQAINSAQVAQSAARQLALQTPANVPDGLGAGGLQVSASAALDVANPNACASTNTCSWQNAELPTQATSGNATTVTVKQNADKAILTWDSFSIGQHTTLHFDQSAGTQRDGTNNWIALNRVSGSAAPSQIYGRILAEGTVYLINQNGILFAGSSQVNVHSLVASTLPLYLPTGATSLKPGDDAGYLAYSNRLFLETGITSVGSNTASGRILGLDNATTLSAAQALNLPGDIKIAAGASIKTDTLGYSLIAAPNVDNAGAIAATEGQVILAAGLGVTLNNSASGSNRLDPVLTGRIFDGSTDVTPHSTLTHSGLIESPRGNITLLGNRIEQNGVLAATSSVTRPGSINIVAIDEEGQRTGTVRMSGRSMTALLPDANDETTISTDTATQTFQRGGISLRGGAVTIENGALIEAPGQNVTISAVAQTTGAIRFGGGQGWVAGRIYIDDGAIVDVAGLADVQMSMADNLVTIARLGLNEFADMPLQRDGVLFGSGVTVDSRQSGTRADGSTWVGTPLANVGGYVDQVPRGIKELLLDGGNIALAGGEVITRGGSTLNLDGGYLHYLGGVITTTRLIAANGAIIDIADADPNLAYIGLAGVHVSQQSRWN